jgi:hypothetical protein
MSTGRDDPSEVAYDGFEDNRVKHMELIQAVVGRLAGNSFLVKGWALTVSGALIGFALKEDDTWLAAAALVPTIGFWGLDGYFLKAERLFRALYNQVRKKDTQVEAFFMGATGHKFVTRVKNGEVDCERKAASWLKTTFSLTLIAFYGVLVAAVVAVMIITCSS